MDLELPFRGPTGPLSPSSPSCTGTGRCRRDGFHSSGPRAPFDRLAREDTATKWSSSPRWDGGAVARYH